MTAIADVRAALRPRRALLPVFLTLALLWVVPVVGADHGCAVAINCPEFVTGSLVGTLGTRLALTYLLAAATLVALDEAVDLTDRFPAAFDPPRTARNGLLAVAVVGGILLAVAGYGALYPPGIGVWLVVVVYAPTFGRASLSTLLTDVMGIGNSGLVAIAIGLTFSLGSVVVQVGWWYVLAYGAARLWSKWTART